jgi:putative spermidine/putrescine transport system ATP-binding protein
VALARGLVFNPDVLLLDEPLGALDKNLREQMQVEIKRIHRELGITTIYVTHDQTEAMTMSDRVVVFESGRLAQIGTPLEVYDRPASRFVAEFIGDSNILPGTIDPARPGIVELAGVGQVRVAAAGAPAGEVDLMIRPEKLRADVDDAAPDLNRFDMTIDDIINYGDSVLVIGKTQGGGLPLRARLVGARADALGPGRVLRLAWAPADAHVLARR